MITLVMYYTGKKKVADSECCKSGEYPICLATIDKDHQMMATLLEYGANPDVRLPEKISRYDKCCPLEIALWNRDNK